MKEGFKVAVVGATGLVGQTMLDLLSARKFPVREVVALASERSRGGSVAFGRKEIDVQVLDDFDFKGVDIALFSAGKAVSEKHVPRAAQAGALVVDNSSAFRYAPEIPLVVPEVNPDALQHDLGQGAIVANPNCSTIQMVVALKPIYDRYGIRSIDVATYQSVSGMGKQAMDALARQTALLMNGRPLEDDLFGTQMAFNVLPKIDEMLDSGYTREEMKMVWETRKIMGDDRLEINATAVRVPVFFGHSEAIHLRTEEPVDVEDVRSLLMDAPGVRVAGPGDEKELLTAAVDASGHDDVLVCRIRAGLDDPYRLNMWVVSDNVRKGAALNSIQIAELLVKSQL